MNLEMQELDINLITLAHTFYYEDFMVSNVT